MFVIKKKIELVREDLSKGEYREARQIWKLLLHESITWVVKNNMIKMVKFICFKA